MILKKLNYRRKSLWCLLLSASCLITLLIGWHVHKSHGILSEDQKNEFQFIREDVKNTSMVLNQVQLFRGVHPNRKALYSIQNDGLQTFVCFDGSRTIKLQEVNDDYCDCIGDGSDEPGTSACNKGRFYCPSEDHEIPSFYVNDGICDCCGGEDEWKRYKPIGFVLPAHPKLHYAPCKVTCGSL